MIVKNTTIENVAINKSVQIDVGTPDPEDGYVLPSQTLDLSKSLSTTDLLRSEQIKNSIYSGDLIYVVDGLEVDQSQSIQIYESGATQWAKIFNPVISKTNLYEGLASGFIYAKNCLIG